MRRWLLAIPFAVVLVAAFIAIALHPGPPPKLPPIPPGTIAAFTERNGACAWELIDARTKAVQPIATFPIRCYAPRVAWRPGGLEALVAFEDRPLSIMGGDVTIGEATDAFTVDLHSGEVRPVPLPHISVSLIGYEKESGNVTAIARIDAEASLADGVRQLLGLDSPSAHDWYALFVRNTGWRVKEREIVDDHYVFAPASWAAGIDETRSQAILGPPYQDPAWIEFADGAVEGTPGKTWSAIELPGNKRVLARRVQSSNGDWTRAGPIAFVHDGRGILADDGGFTGAQVVVSVDDGTGIVLAVRRGDGSYPRVYDVETGALLWSSDVYEAAVLWPITSPSASSSPSASP